MEKWVIHSDVSINEKNLQYLVNPLFNRSLYIYDKFVFGKWVNCHHFFVDEKNLQKFGLTGEFISV